MQNNGSSLSIEPADKFDGAMVWIAALLLAIWPLPDTMPGRNLLLLAGLLMGGRQLWRYARSDVSLHRYWPVAILLAFFPWLLWHVVVWPTLPEEQLYDLSGDWARAFCATITGLAVGITLATTSMRTPSIARRHNNILLAGLSGTVLIYAARYGYEVLQTGVAVHHDFFEHPYAGKTASVVFGGLFLVAVCVRLLDTLRLGRFGVAGLTYVAAILLVLANFYFANTKNGFIIFMACTALFVLGLARSPSGERLRSPKRWLIPALTAAVVLIAFASHWRSNPAWRNMVGNVRLCYDIEHYDFWKDQNGYPMPVSATGKPVDISTCQRVAWAHAGLILIGEHPGGFGLIHHSFGAQAIQRWEGFIKPEGKRRGATHSGLIDFTLGFGVFGLLLVLTPLLVAFQRARRRQGFWYRYTQWAVPVLLLSYLVTEVCTGHFIELLFFITAMFSTLCATEQGAQPTPQAT